MPLMAWTRCVGCYLQGVGQSLQSVVVFVCEELVFLIACALVMRRFWGAEGVFASFTVSQLLLILVLNMAVYLRRDRRYKGLEACSAFPGPSAFRPKTGWRETWFAGKRSGPSQSRPSVSARSGASRMKRPT